MDTTTGNKIVLKGGEWLITESNPHETFIPEDFSEEQKMIQDMGRQFIKTEVLPVIERVEKLEPGLMPSLMQKAGDLGLLGASIPEEYGGLGKDLVLLLLLLQKVLVVAILFALHLLHIPELVLCQYCILEQKSNEKNIHQKWLSGEWKGAYGLTEPNSGSDALGAKTTAVLSADGKHYILNGQKCWITNGGFADVYTVFAKIDGDKFTAFIIRTGNRRLYARAGGTQDGH